MAGRAISMRALRAARMALIGIAFLYAWIGETAGPRPKPLSPLLRLVVYWLAAGIIPSGLLLRSLELKRAKAALARQPREQAALGRWRVMQLVILATFVAIPLYGLILRFQGGTLVQALPFYIVGLLSLSLFPLHEARSE